MIRAVCFDFDGVLAPLVDIHRQAFLRTLRGWGCDVSEETHDELLDGLSTRQKLRKLREAGTAPTLTDADIEGLNARKQELTMLAIEGYQPDPVKIGMLARLRDNNLRLACVSNSIRQTTMGVLRKGQMAPYFHVVLSNEDVAEQKPSPVPYLTAFRDLHVEPHEVLIIEDQPQGVASARASGAHVVVVESYDDVDYGLLRREIDAVDRESA